MYISEIELVNIRCFEKLVIDLKKDGDIILWTTILGDNAVGKSTILKCIAMGLCDESSAAALMKESGEFLRKNEEEGHIRLVVEQKVGNRKIEILTKIKKENLESPENLRQEITNGNACDDLFFCGYGVEIGNVGSTAYKKYTSLEAVYTLFNYNSELQNPELIMRRQDKSIQNILEKKLLNILMLEDCTIDYNKTGMVVRSPLGEVLIGELSDGYQSVALKIIDFFGWAGYANKLVKIGDEISGILLIDELDNHLHAKWQRFIVGRLRKQLKDVQIIITTHSPIITLGTTDLYNALLLELELNPLVDSVAKYKQVYAEEYRGMTVDQILTAPPFRLPIARSGETGNNVIRFQELMLKTSLSKEEQHEFDKLKSTIQELPDVFETMENLRIHNEIRVLLAKETNDSDKK